MDKGVAHKNLTQLTFVPNITERRTRMIELGDVFIAFPGGTGTLEEISEVVTKSVLTSWHSLVFSIISTVSTMI